MEKGVGRQGRGEEGVGTLSLSPLLSFSLTHARTHTHTCVVCVCVCVCVCMCVTFRAPRRPRHTVAVAPQ